MDNLVRLCAQCGEPIDRLGRGKPGRGRPAKFCSIKCKNAHHIAARQGSAQREEQPCVVCGKSFLATPNGSRYTCSAACSRKRFSAERSDSRMAARRERGPCKQCGQKIPETVRVHATFCSMACQQEAAHEARNRSGSHRAYMRRYLYGITAEEFDALLATQDGTCAICRTDNWPGKGKHLDHDHETGRVRGILCHRCNLALGHLGDRVDLLEAAIAYIKRGQVSTQCALCGASSPADVCNNCLQGIGDFKNDPAILRAAADYLER